MIEVADASTSNDFEEGWNLVTLDSKVVAKDKALGVIITFDAACTIFFVMTVLDMTGLSVNGEDVSLIRVESRLTDWRPAVGYVDVPAGAGVMFQIKNNTDEASDPALAYITRTRRHAQ